MCSAWALAHHSYWTLCLHCVYFTVDKSSPNATTAIRLLHGASFSGAIAVFIGYSFISIGGMYRFGSWLLWENAVGARAGTVSHDRGFGELASQKAFEHLWPVIAALVDLKLSQTALVKAFAGAEAKRTTILAVGSYLVFGTVWEQVSKGVGKGSPLEVYVQPEGLRTTNILKSLGMDNPSLPEDLIFTNAQKLALIGGAFYMYWTHVAPLFKKGQPSYQASAKKGK
jgi:hypothetical protein